MKLATRNRDVHANKIKKTVSYKVANTAHLMELLSGLYSDPLLATIRELSTNAIDAHDMANNEKPFYVHLPNSDDLTLKIRDYGTGLSESELENLYTVYGLSDKTHTNEQRGCLGVGSKSPFTYCDTFITVSYYNGTKYTAVNTLDRHGKPTFNIVGDEPTDEENGLEVSFKIKSNDVHNITNIAAKVYRWFNIIPACNTPKLEERILSLQNELENSVIFKSDNIGYQLKHDYKKSLAIMGNIAYPIEGGQVDKKYRFLFNDYSLILHFDIGELDFVPSRDALKYTKHTLDSINNKLSNIIIDLEKQIQSNIDTEKYFWDKIVKFHDYYTNYRSLFDGIDPGFLYNNNKITNNYIKTHINTFLNSLEDQEKLVVCPCNNNSRTVTRIARINKTKFVINNLSNKGYAAIRRYCKNNNDILYLLERPNYTPEQNAKFLCDSLGVNPDDILYTADFPKAILTPRAPKPKRDKDVLDCQLMVSGTRIVSHNWRTHETKISDGGCYVGLQNYKIQNVTNSWRFSQYNLYEIINKCNIGPLYGLTTLRQQKIANNKKWKTVKQALKEYLDKWFANSNNSTLYYSSDLKELHTLCCSAKKYLNQNTTMFKFLDSFPAQRADDSIYDINQIIEMHNFFLGDSYKIPPCLATKFSYNKIIAEYPMLAIVDTYEAENSPKTVANYINNI